MMPHFIIRILKYPFWLILFGETGRPFIPREEKK
jgi:hypothetical protein